RMSGGAVSVGRCIGVRRNQEAPGTGSNRGPPGDGRSWSRAENRSHPWGDDLLEDADSSHRVMYFKRPGRWCQAPAGKTASVMTIWKVRITDWPVASNVASTSTE